MNCERCSKPVYTGGRIMNAVKEKIGYGFNQKEKVNVASEMERIGNNLTVDNASREYRFILDNIMSPRSKELIDRQNYDNVESTQKKCDFEMEAIKMTFRTLSRKNYNTDEEMDANILVECLRLKKLIVALGKLR
jgi:hypothetical protein